MSKYDSLRQQIIKYAESLEESLSKKNIYELFSRNEVEFLRAAASMLRDFITKYSDNPKSLILTVQFLSIIDFIIASTVAYGREYANKLIDLLSRMLQLH